MNIDEEIKLLELSKDAYLKEIVKTKGYVNDCSLKIRRLERLKKEMAEIINPAKPIEGDANDLEFKDPKQLEIEESTEFDVSRLISIGTKQYKVIDTAAELKSIKDKLASYKGKTKELKDLSEDSLKYPDFVYKTPEPEKDTNTHDNDLLDGLVGNDHYFDGPKEEPLTSIDDFLKDPS